MSNPSPAPGGIAADPDRMNRRRLAIAAYAIAVAVVVVDQALKYWVLAVLRLPDRPSVQVVGPFWLTMVWNRGVSFGFLNIGADWSRWALSAFSLAVTAALALWARRIERPLLAIAVGLIMGGAVGNAIDRIRLGAVTDFLDFSRLWFPWVFNIADSGISVGSLLLIWELFVTPQAPGPD